MKAQMLTKETVLNYGSTEKNYPNFKIGDTIEVSLIIRESAIVGKGKDKKTEVTERIQTFEGYVVADHNNGAASTFTVRKISANNVGVERILPYYSPRIAGIKLIKRGKVRRAKLNYLRDRVGRSARVKELVETAADKAKAKL